nr:M23 family metallopeptidase [Hyphomonas sp. Mor2]
MFSKPVLNEADMVSEFGMIENPFRDGIQWHGGIDLAASFSAPVHAPADGIVLFADSETGYGRVVDLKVSEGWVIRMAHLSKIRVRAGDRVEAGHVLGEVGSTGRDVPPHLHLETRFHDKQYDPELMENLSFYESERTPD